MPDQTTINQVCTHLRLMGYGVSVADDEIKTIGARHRERLNILVKVFDAGIFLSALCGVGESAKRYHTGYLEFINGLNKRAIAARFYADADSDLNIECVYTGEYIQARFGNFLQLWHSECGKIAENVQARKYLK